MPAKVAVAGGAAMPVIWTFLGYQFEAASMIAGLCACVTVRVWMTLNDTSRKSMAIDATVTCLTLLFTAGIIMKTRPEPFFALVYGTGIGALGAGIIKLALAWVQRGEALAGLVDPEEVSRPVPNPDNQAAIKQALRQLHHMPLSDEPQPPTP
jgi:hypothetical protein